MTQVQQSTVRSWPGAAKKLTFTIEFEHSPVDPSVVSFEFGRCLHGHGHKTIDPATLVEFVYGVDDNVVRLTTGIYEITVLPDTPGWWACRAIAGGTYAGAFEVYWQMLDSHFVPEPG